jgi:hypothetical protein
LRDSARRSPGVCLSRQADLRTTDVERPESTAAGGPARISAAALSMITKKNLPMRAIFFRDHEISGLGPAGADPLRWACKLRGGRGRGGLRGRVSGAALGTGSVPRPGASTGWPPDTAAALSLSRSAGAAKDLSAANPVSRGQLPKGRGAGRAAEYRRAVLRTCLLVRRLARRNPASPARASLGRQRTRPGHRTVPRQPGP